MTKEALEVLNPMELLAMRFIIAALLMSILVIAGIIQVDFKGKPIGLLALMCLFQPIAYFTFETYGLANAATNVAGIILGALPAGVAIMEALLLKERLSALQSAGLSMSIVGVILVAVFGQGHNTETKPIGIIFLTGSMLSAVFFNIASKKAAESFSPVERTFAMMWSAAICFFIPALFENIKGKGNISHLFGEWNRIAGVWGGILYLGILSSVGAFFLINYFSLSTQSLTICGVHQPCNGHNGAGWSLDPKEQFSWSQGLSVILIILGIAVVNSSFKEKAKS